MKANVLRNDVRDGITSKYDLTYEDEAMILTLRVTVERSVDWSG